MSAGDRGLDLTRHAVALATLGLPGNTDRGPVDVLPLRGKAPAIPGSRGVLDAHHDVEQLRREIARYRPTGLGVRIPPWAVVLDVDPRHGGDVTLARLVTEHGPLPATLTTVTGRGDGGQHLWYLRPAGQLTGRRLPGIDLKIKTGYVCVELTIHPDTGGVYRWQRPIRPVAPMLSWLAELITEPERAVQVLPRSGGIAVGRLSGPSAVDEINRSLNWHQVLDGHGWQCVRGDGDTDGSAWRHPAATSKVSATTRGGRLYVWSPNALFDVSEPGSPRGYSRAEAVALLDFDGDLSALITYVRTTGASA